MADDVLYAGVRGVTDLMVQPGLINLDFSDVKTVMSEMGKAMMGTGEASGEGRAIAAAEAAIANPLIDDVSLKGAKGLIINITGGNDITLYEVDEAANRIKQEVDDDANIIYGTTCDERLEGLVRVSIVATGIDVNSVVSPKPLENISSLKIDNSIYLEKNLEINENSILHQNKTDTTENKDQMKDNAILDSAVEISDNDELSGNKEPFIYSGSLNISNEMNSDETLVLDNEKNHESLNDEIDNNETLVLDDEKNHESLNNEMNDDEILVLDDEKNNQPLNIDNNKDSFLAKEDVIEDDSKQSVRKLSLFDTLEKNETFNLNSSDQSEIKNEPVFKDTLNEAESVSEEDVSNEEFSGAEEDIDEGFNQESQEELLDIPTFLRRQAN